MSVVATTAAGLMDALEEEGAVEIEDVLVVVAFKEPCECDDPHCEGTSTVIRWRCTDERYYVQVGMIEAARQGLGHDDRGPRRDDDD